MVRRNKITKEELCERIGEIIASEFRQPFPSFWKEIMMEKLPEGEYYED